MKNDSFSVKVSDLYTFDGSDLESIDIVSYGPGLFHLIRDGVSYHGKVISTDFDNKTVVVRVDGARHELRVLDAYDELVEKLGLAAVSKQKVKEVVAPMPGMVLEINVGIGDSVQEGQPLLILEAMKMENVLKAVGEATVKGIEVEQGQAVDKNQLLITFE